MSPVAPEMLGDPYGEVDCSASRVCLLSPTEGTEVPVVPLVTYRTYSQGMEASGLPEILRGRNHFMLLREDHLS